MTRPGSMTRKDGIVYTVDMADTVSIRDLRNELADVVDRAQHHDEPTIISRRGREVAAVVSIETLREWERWEDERLGQAVRERMASDDGSPGVPLAEVVAETLERPT